MRPTSQARSLLSDILYEELFKIYYTILPYIERTIIAVITSTSSNSSNHGLLVKCCGLSRGRISYVRQVGGMLLVTVICPKRLARDTRNSPNEYFCVIIYSCKKKGCPFLVYQPTITSRVKKIQIFRRLVGEPHLKRPLNAASPL